jgi:DNA polymerase-3 subunit epsilon
MPKLWMVNLFRTAVRLRGNDNGLSNDVTKDDTTQQPRKPKPMREIVLDTETTGLDPNSGHRIVEIACVELISHMPTGRHFHHYLNPERDMPLEAFKIHGLSAEFLSNHGLFESIAGSFLDFIETSPLIIHNAGFDMKFLNYELRKAGYPMLGKHPVVDTVPLARKAFPGSLVNLDALCRRFKIDLSRRDKHGALLDAQLLAEVYLELKGGKQHGMAFMKSSENALAEAALAQDRETPKKSWPLRSFPLSAEDQAAHTTFLEKHPKALWHKVK